jgi:hypothetical protein
MIFRSSEIFISTGTMDETDEDESYSDDDPADDEFWLPVIEGKNECICVMCQLSV